ncbi:uncharacterized protein LOC130677274 [Microplitis mediator]|uniref:uncharacterized protein LOC130677274 n=1 Tax=Microplitis mediator TaxID=375433 RepID=UPI0025550CD3|nr:uncharacterized protein LOC130677274 [Microplitis mediator]XP_057339954.1 uncharacterized protein LOC130677274 [Microplitis mediator]
MLLLFLMTSQLYIIGVFAENMDYLRPEINPVDVKTYENNFGWTVGIFKRTFFSSKDNNVYEYICQGALINPKIVLAPGLCIVKGTKLSHLKVRGYDPINNDPKRDDALRISYVNRNIIKVFYHWKTDNENFSSVSKRNLIVMVLDLGIIHYPAIGILQPTMERSINSDGCLLVSLFEDVQGLIVHKLDATYTEISQCQSRSYIEPINNAEFTETSETTLCAPFVKPIEQALPLGSTLICRYNEDPATYFLTGMLLDQNQLWTKLVKLENTASWINKTLNEYKINIKIYTE